MQALGLIDAVVWFIVVEAAAFSTFPLLARAMPSAPDRGFGLSKVCGVLALGLPAWIIPTLFHFAADRMLVTAVFGVLVLWGLTQYSTVYMRAVLAACRTQLLVAEMLFLGLSLAFLIVRFFNPEIVWGEKPMDSTFLHFFVRSESLPPQDPWAAGHQMQYYYLGVYFIATLLKLTGIPVAIGYNLTIATLAGFIGAALYSGALLFLRRAWIACTAAAFVVISCNPEVLLTIVRCQSLVGPCVLNLELPTFDNTFWPSSRVFVSPGFFEYTLWSLLFADLHAHVVAIPFTALALLLAVYLALYSHERYSSHGLLLRVLLGLALGSLFGVNTWDCITYGVVVGLLLAVASAPRFWRPPARPDGTVGLGERAFATLFARAVAAVWDFGVVGLCAAAIGLVFKQQTMARSSAGWGWVTETEFNSVYQVFQALGFWMILSSATLVCLVWCSKLNRKSAGLRVGLLVGAVVCVVIALMPALVSMQQGISGQSYGLLGFVCCFTVLAFLAVTAWRRESFSKALLVLLIYPFALLLVLEHFFLMDRMNTLFKGYMAIWLISGFSSVVVAGLYALWVLQHGARRARLLYATAVGGLGCCVVIGAAMDVRAVLHMQRVPERVYTLDGSEYVKAVNSEDYQIIQWLNRYVAGAPVMVEAHGPSYRNYGRISMHTGIPIVLGWEYHVQQRGLSVQEVHERQGAISELYTGSDDRKIEQLIEKYKVDLIIVGADERELYGDGILARFRRRSDLLIKIASFGSSHIFATLRSPYKDLLR